MNIRRFVGPVRFATCIADWLSIMRGAIAGDEEDESMPHLLRDRRSSLNVL